jgi:hypothetical protein
MNTLTAPLIEAPASDDITQRETLAYAEAHDAATNTDYAFVAYKETHRATGAWWVRIASPESAGAYFHPNSIRLQARAAAAHRKTAFIWDSVMSPRLGDPRKIEFRVHVIDGEPAAVEIYIRLRKADHTAGGPVSMIFPWPATSAEPAAASF